MIPNADKSPRPSPTTRDRQPRVRDLQVVISDVFNRRLSFDEGTGFQGGPSAKRRGYRLALWSWLAAVIDILILFSASCSFILMFSFIMRTPFGVLASSLYHHRYQALFFGEVFLVSAWIYSVAVRAFMGFTIGEWACDLRLGQPHERIKVGSYIFKVAIRSFFVLATGVFILPLLSLALGKDLAGEIVNLKLYSLQ